MQHQPRQQSLVSESRTVQRSPLAESPFDYIVCCKCRKDYSSGTASAAAEPFYITACTHALCHSCLWPSPAVAPPDPHSSLVNCPACGSQGRVIRLQEGDAMGGVGYCFKPIRELLDELGVALEYQTGSLKDQLQWMKERVVQQRAVLNKVKDELSKSREVKK